MNSITNMLVTGSFITQLAIKILIFFVTIGSFIYICLVIKLLTIGSGIFRNTNFNKTYLKELGY